jgi:hypothetical protein
MPFRGTGGRAEARCRNGKNSKPGKGSKNAARTHLSTAPWNDGRRSFSTKERLVINGKSPQKGVVFQEKGAFSTFSK